jgi:hypothetical protein
MGKETTRTKNDKNIKNIRKTKRKLKKMNCNPGVKSDVKNSCYTSSALAHIKGAYNSTHNDKITSSHPTDIWKNLRDNLNECPREDCWLNEIKNKESRRQLDDILFAPDRPSDWDNDPVAWLSNYDIAAVLRQYEKSHPEFKLLGPTAIDYDTVLYDDKCVWNDLCRLSMENLVRRNKRKLGIVFTLDKHDGPGSHWVSMFVDLDNSMIFYYDSALNAVPQEVSKLKREIIKQGKNLEKPIHFNFMQNEISHQSTNTECGMYCLFFIITLLTEKLDRQIKRDLYGGGKKPKNKFFELLPVFTDPGLSDDMMIRFRQKYFNKK